MSIRAGYCFLIPAGIICFLGCTSASLKTQTVIPASSVVPTARSMDSARSVPRDSFVVKQPIAASCDTTTDSLSLRANSADSLITTAELCSDEGNFIWAHALLRKAIARIEQDEESADEEPADPSDLTARIAQLYIEKLPKEYLDSIPQSIANLVLRYQLSSALDTFSLSPTDSSILSILNCENGIPYNIPITHNKRVNKALFFLVNSRSLTVQHLLVKANYYLPMMRRFFSENNLPTDLAFTPLLESGFNPKAYSYAHASGIWQFIPSTGRRYALRKNFWIDEARDPLKSTRAAINYLKDLYSLFNNWYLALAAYNCGENAIERAINKYGTDNYWELKLPRQTMNYVPLFIAYQIVGKNPQCFGFTVPSADTFCLDTVHLSDCMDLHKIAEGVHLTYDEIKDLNPHITHFCTPPDMDNITLYLPAGPADTFKTFYNSLTDEDKVKWYNYKVRNGDNLSSIARRFHISLDALKSINNLKGNFIKLGKYLFIPIPITTPYPSASAENKETTAGSTPLTENNNLLAYAKLIKYKVKSGESLAQIADLFNTTVENICKWNTITNQDTLKNGQILRLYTSPAFESTEHTQQTKKKQIDSIPPNSQKGTYVVASGDNLYAIARKLNVSLEALAAWNDKDIDRPLLHPDEKLVYYITQSIQQQAPVKKEIPSPKNGTLYKVAKGDNLYRIAQLFSVDLNELLSINNFTKHTVIKPGDTIRIPQPKMNKQSRAPSNHSIFYFVGKEDRLQTDTNRSSLCVETLSKMNAWHKKSILMPADIRGIILSEES